MRPNVTVQDRIEVAGLRVETEPGGGWRVSGVAIRRRGRDAGASGSEALEADLVVDATGRASKLPDWLAGLGPAHRLAMRRHDRYQPAGSRCGEPACSLPAA